VARFRRVNEGCRTVHHDALELPNGEIVFVTRLCQGQFASVIQLPATKHRYAATENEATEVNPALRTTE
jgi:hypothetical protein